MKTNISMCFAAQLVLCALLRIARPAPVITTNPVTTTMDEALVETVQTCLSLTKKITDEIPGIHKSCVKIPSLTLDLNDDLSKWQHMSEEMGIPTDSKLTLPPNSVAEAFSDILRGLQPFKVVLDAIKDHVTHHPALVKGLAADLEELVVYTSVALNYTGGSPSQHTLPTRAPFQLDDYKVQVATHLTLLRLHRFGQQVFRLLRSLKSP